VGPTPRSVRGLIAGGVFAAAAAGTIAWCGSMGAGMPMPGGWTMSMAWMMGAPTFVGMWALMMIAMMLPSMTPVLLHHRRPVRVAIAYVAVWGLAGVVVFPVGAAVASLAMRHEDFARAVPWVCAAVCGLAGAWQLTHAKLRALARCRDRACCALGRRPTPHDAWVDGLRLGLRCVRCCVAPMAVLLALGVMSLPVMGAVGASITIERLAPRPRWWVRGFGIAAIASAVLLRL